MASTPVMLLVDTASFWTCPVALSTSNAPSTMHPVNVATWASTPPMVAVTLYGTPSYLSTSPWLRRLVSNARMALAEGSTASCEICGSSGFGAPFNRFTIAQYSSRDACAAAFGSRVVDVEKVLDSVDATLPVDWLEGAGALEQPHA